MITDFSSDSIIVQLAEEKAELEMKCKELEKKLKTRTADDYWSIAFTVLGLSTIFGVFLATFFCFQTYRQGYDSAEEKYKKEICAESYPNSVSAFTKCVDKGE
jgi:hypothetical protein